MGNLRRHPLTSVTDSIPWAGNARVSILNVCHSQAEYEQFCQANEPPDAYLIPDALHARAASAKLARQALQWGLQELNTVRLITCKFPSRLPDSVTADGLFPPVQEQEARYHQVVHRRLIRPEVNRIRYVPPRLTDLEVLAIDISFHHGPNCVNNGVGGFG